jgi:hypothetical protein
VIRRLRILPLLIATAFAAVPLLIAAPTPVSANHSWGNYHWARTSNPFNLKVGDNVTSAWDTYLDGAISDWSASTVLDLTKVAGSANPKNCRATAGRIEACNSRYGNTGWLGVAQIWASGDHITQAVTKLNDTYFSTASYNTPAWRRLVSCQEIAHDFGLDHQDENFNNANLGSCMDYTSDPDGPPSNEHPNQHDYDQLETIYAHLDSTTTIASTLAPAPGRSGTAADEGPNAPADFGQPTGRRDGFGRSDLFVKTLPDGRRMFTHVFWTLQSRGRR